MSESENYRASTTGAFRVLRHFFIAYPKRTIGVVALLALAGFAEGVSVIALLPLLQYSLSGSGGSSETGQFIGPLLSLFGASPSVGSLLLMITGGIIFKAAVTLVAMKEAGYAASRLMTELRRRLITAVLAAKWSYFVDRPLGLFSNAISAETIRAGVTYQQAARFAAVAIQALIYGVVTVALSWKLALLAVLAGSLGAFLFRRLVAVAQMSGAQQTEIMKLLSVRTTDMLQGLKAIKAMGAERSVMPMLSRQIGELDDAQNRQVWAGEFLRVAQEPLLAVLLALGIYVAIRYGEMSLPVLMVLALVFYRLFNRFQAMQEIFQQIGIGASAYWSVLGLCEDAENRQELSSGRERIAATLPTIDLLGVSLAYGERCILRDLNLRIAPGEFVALSGPSGGGKTTLLDLMAGILPPTRGAVQIDGRDLREVELASWRKQIGYVPQEVLLLHDTIYRNIALGDMAITRGRAEEALRAAGIWDYVAALPERLDTVVGERGNRFSGGQRQRISLARALARKPNVLLLDEITASLDKDTQHEVCLTLKSLAGSMTIVAVSHQMEMTRVCDRVIRVEDGTLRSAA